MTETATAGARALPPRTKSPWWAKALLVLFVLILIAGAAAGGVAFGTWSGASAAREEQIQSITREQQIIFATVEKSGVETERGEALNLLGLDVPGTERLNLIRYTYDAQFGIEGGEVDIERTGDHAYRVSIPEFKPLGTSDPDFETLEEANGLLSWTTAPIDQAEAFERIVDPDELTAAADLEQALPLLKDQATSFYTNIIVAIDPDVSLEFTFMQ